MRKKTTPKTKTEKKGPSASYSQFASTTDSGARRMLFIGAVTDQRKEVTSGTRLTMVGTSRWAVRNSPIYKQCIDEAVLSPSVTALWLSQTPATPLWPLPTRTISATGPPVAT